jgi:hypothetical protein
MLSLQQEKLFKNIAVEQRQDHAKNEWLPPRLTRDALFCIVQRCWAIEMRKNIIYYRTISRY